LFRPDEYRLLDKTTIEDPVPFYQSLLNHAPVYKIPDVPLYLVSGWDLIHDVLKNQDDYSANLTGVLITGTDGCAEMFNLSQFGRVVNTIANADDPFHAVHRKILLPQITRKKIEAMEPQIRIWARDRVQQLKSQTGVDCIQVLANEIPLMVTADLMGLPVTDVDKLLKWAFSGGEILAGTCRLQDMVALGMQTFEMSDYLTQHFQFVQSTFEVSQEPTHITEALVKAVHDDLISEEDAISIMIVLVGAAGESTSSLVGSAIRVLAQNPDIQSQLRKNANLLEPYIEEIVRLESPFKGHYRAVRHETKLGGVTIPEGSWLFLLWAAANRDPSMFQNPNAIDLHRRNPRDHIGFGYGVHFCIGARLARLETRLILEQLLNHTNGFTLKPGHAITHISSMFVRRLSALSLRIN